MGPDPKILHTFEITATEKKITSTLLLNLPVRINLFPTTSIFVRDKKLRAEQKLMYFIDQLILFNRQFFII